MRYRVGDEIFIKGKVVNIVTSNPYDPYPSLFYQVNIGETGDIIVSENRITDILKLVKPAQTIDAKEYEKGHFK